MPWEQQWQNSFVSHQVTYCRRAQRSRSPRAARIESFTRITNYNGIRLRDYSTCVRFANSFAPACIHIHVEILFSYVFLFGCFFVSSSARVYTGHIQIDGGQPPAKIPRPANAFMLYANANRKKMAREFPLDSNKEISKRLGRGWKELDREAKGGYYEMAKEVDAAHKEKYPGELRNQFVGEIGFARAEGVKREAHAVRYSARGLSVHPRGALCAPGLMQIN